MAATTEDTQLIHYRLTQVEDKVEKIDGKLANMEINVEVLKTELSHAAGKQSTIISSIVSVVIGVAIAVFTGSIG
jgi:tetrahydromethanopterin S-methyltransferase subunit G